MALLVSAALGFAGVTWLVEHYGDRRDRVSNAGDSGTMTYRDMGAATAPAEQGPDFMARMLAARSATDLMLLHPGDQPLQGEPAGVAPYRSSGPPVTVTREAGFRRVAAGMAEEVSFWRIRGASIEALAAHYEQAVRQAGFTPVGSSRFSVSGANAPAGAEPGPAPTAPAPQPAWNRVFFRAGAGRSGADEVLIVRLSPADPDTARVMVRLLRPAGP